MDSEKSNNYVNAMFDTSFDTLLERAKARAKNLQRFVDEVLVDGKHYGSATGGKGGKKSLLKPGAEEALAFFGLVPTYKIEVVRGSGDAEPAFSVSVICEAHVGDTNGRVVGEGVGAGNSHETKWRYRKDDNGRRSINPDLYGAQNTILKFAKKRALVDCALGVIPGLSCIFTQDMEPEETGGADDFLGLDSKAPEKPREQKVFNATGNVVVDGDSLAKLVAEATNSSADEVVRKVTLFNQGGKVYSRTSFAKLSSGPWEKQSFEKLSVLAAEHGIEVKQ